MMIVSSNEECVSTWAGMPTMQWETFNQSQRRS